MGLIARPGAWTTVIPSNTTATARTIIDCRLGRDLLVAHYIAPGASTGGYCSLNMAGREPEPAAADTSPTWYDIATIARSSNVVTVTTETHTFPNDTTYLRIWVVETETTDTTEYDGFYVVASAADTTHFTYAQTGNDNTGTPATGKVKVTTVIPHHAGGQNIKSGDTTAPYTCVFQDVSPYVELVCNVTDGTHAVGAQLID